MRDEAIYKKKKVKMSHGRWTRLQMTFKGQEAVRKISSRQDRGYRWRRCLSQGTSLCNSQKVNIAVFLFLCMVHVCIHGHVYANVGHVCACGDGSQRYHLPQMFFTTFSDRVPEIQLSPSPSRCDRTSDEH